MAEVTEKRKPGNVVSMKKLFEHWVPQDFGSRPTDGSFSTIAKDILAGNLEIAASGLAGLNESKKQYLVVISLICEDESGELSAWEKKATIASILPKVLEKAMVRKS